MLTYQHISNDLLTFANKDKTRVLMRYFKTQKGEYGEGDIFLGVTVPLQRKIAKKGLALSFAGVEKLLKSKIHEHRFTALEILAMKFEKAKTESEKEKIVALYLKNRNYINNWDLVDTSAPYIIGEHYFSKPKDFLYSLAKSENIWDRRIAMVATHHFIKNGNFEDTFKLTKIYLNDKHDLIHKATGWMLREVGKRDLDALINYLDAYYLEMPRTMLRYAIENLPDHIRQLYMKRTPKRSEH
jgi:3-methyladenine DNA glycosylase AlkD